MKPKGLCFLLVIFSDSFIASALEDTIENGIISYDKDSVDLIVNIALSLFDSLQDFTKHINETEEKIKVKFKPKLIIEEVDTEPDLPEHGELLFLEDEPELREINYDDEEDTSLANNEISKSGDYSQGNLLNHRKDALNDSEARKIAIKMALEDTRDQGRLENIINQSLVNEEEEGKFANQQENEIIIDDEIEDYKFKFHKEFPNIYSQSDSVFDIGKEVGQYTNYDKISIKIEDQNVEEVSDYENEISERRSDEQMSEEVTEIEENQEPDAKSNSVSPEDNEVVKHKQRKRRKRRKRPFDGRENWEKLNKAIFGDGNISRPEAKEAEIESKLQENVLNQKKSEEKNLLDKKKRRRKRKKGGKRKPDWNKAIKSKQTFHIKRERSKLKPLAARPMPKIQLRGRPLNLQSFLNIF